MVLVLMAMGMERVGLSTRCGDVSGGVMDIFPLGIFFFFFFLARKVGRGRKD